MSYNKNKPFTVNNIFANDRVVDLCTSNIIPPIISKQFYYVQNDIIKAWAMTI